MNFTSNGKGNNKTQANTNTNGIQLSNKDGFDPSTLGLAFWNNMISVKMNPALEKSKQTENKVFDYEATIQTTLTIEKAQVLLEKINEVILPAIREGKEASRSVIIGGDSLLYIGTGVKQFGEVKPHLAIFKSLDADTKKPEIGIFYEFKTCSVISDYDHITGSFQQDSPVSAELSLFIKFLEVAIEALTHAHSHSQRTVDRYFREKLNEAVGVKSGSSFGGRTTTRNIFGDDTSTQSNSQTVDKENVGSINDFLQ